MKKLILIVSCFISVQVNSLCQDRNLYDLLGELEKVELPFKIDSFCSFISNNRNDIELYNMITKKGVGYMDSKGKYHKSTSNYNVKSKTRIHEKLFNGKYEKYQVNDSIKIQFIGIIKLSEIYTCILVKIEDVPNDFQKAYYFKLLTFNKNGIHLSSINVFELIDDASTKDWLQEKPSPNVTSLFEIDGSIKIKWDEGYNESYLQHVKLNEEGLFYVEKLEKNEK